MAAAISATAEQLHLDEQVLRGRDRSARVALARQIAMAACRHLGYSTLEIAAELRRDHSTVVHAERVIERRRSEEAHIDQALRAVLAAVETPVPAGITRPRPLHRDGVVIQFPAAGGAARGGASTQYAQRRRALQIGNAVRVRKAAALAALRDMPPSEAARVAAQAVRLLPDWAKPASSYELLRAVHKIGRTKAQKMCALAGIANAQQRDLQQLGPQTRERLAAELEAFASRVNDAPPATRPIGDPAQRAAALRRANDVRQTRARKLAAISDMHEPGASAAAAAELIRDGRHDDRLAALPLSRIVAAIHRVGTKRAADALRQLGFHGDTKLGALSARRADQLADGLLAFVAGDGPVAEPRPATRELLAA